MEGIEPEALEALQGYSWPGNVRELENVMQRAIILAPGQMVRAEDLTLSNPKKKRLHSTTLVDIADYQSAVSFERQIHEYKVKLAVAAVRENTETRPLPRAAFASPGLICIA